MACGESERERERERGQSIPGSWIPFVHDFILECWRRAHVLESVCAAWHRGGGEPPPQALGKRERERVRTAR